jgi:hypothetical protein
MQLDAVVPLLTMISLLAELEKQATVDLNPENTKALRDILQVQIESAEECAICEYCKLLTFSINTDSANSVRSRNPPRACHYSLRSQLWQRLHRARHRRTTQVSHVSSRVEGRIVLGEADD